LKNRETEAKNVRTHQLLRGVKETYKYGSVECVGKWS